MQRPRHVPARVLGALRPGAITFLLSVDGTPAVGGVPLDVDRELVPLELRAPATEATLIVVDSPTGQQVVGVTGR
jgi:hypothetical protein